MGNKSKRKKKAESIERIVGREILRFLKRNSRQSYNHKQISAGAGLKGTISSRKLITLLERFAEDGKIERKGRGKYGIVSMVQSMVEGKIELFKDGFGFVAFEEGEQDIFIGPSDTLNAMNGDKVQVKITKMRGRSRRPEGRVVEVLERVRTEFVGTVEKTDIGRFIVQPDDSKVPFHFRIAPDELHEAEVGQKVVVEFIKWTRGNPDGKIIRVLGNAGENDTEMHAILLQYGFDPEFPEGIEAEAEAIPTKITAAEIKKRRDIRDITTFTIDPVDAKDFDDAISYQILENGNLEVGIHIADVAHYVQPGTALDKEAQRRATSVYLVDRTVPMLPEALSNVLCSLRPHEDKLAFSAMFELDQNGKTLKEWYGRTVIHSDRRFAYEEAQEVMDNKKGDLADELLHLNKMAKMLRKKRFKYGAIEFEEDEVRFELDENGKPLSVRRKIRVDAHKLIEEYMLLANRKVSQFVTQMRDPEPLYVYRIHDKPDEEKLRTLKTFVNTLGYDLDLTNERSTQATMNAMMSSILDKPERSIIRQVAVRSMAKAVYSTSNIGHYGLAFKFYSHFTSPIRRYPDVLAHRLLAKYLAGDFSVNPTELDEQCKHSSKMEKKASDAERTSVKQKQVEFLEDKIGEQFSGIISGVTRWGIYVELEANKCEGMIDLQSMTDDYYDLDEDNYCLRGRRSKKEIHLGDRVMVEVRETNSYKRTIDFDFIEVLESRTQAAKGKKA